MKFAKIFSIYMIFLTQNPLSAQWTSQGGGFFGFNFDVTQLRAVDDKTLWAGVNTYPWSPARAVGPWITNTKDGGLSWQLYQIPGAEGHAVWGMSVVGKDKVWVALNNRRNRQKHSIYHSPDGGKTWQKQFEGRYAGFGVHFFDAQNGVTIQGARFRHTSDGGKTWSAADSIPMAPNNVFLNASESFDAFGDTIWFPSIDGNIARSVNKGKNWQVIKTPLTGDKTTFNLLNFTNGRNGLGVAKSKTTPEGPDSLYYALDTTLLYHTTDGGLTWTRIPHANLPQPPFGAQYFFYASGIGAVRGTNNTFVMSATYGLPDYTSKSVTYISYNGGLDWKLLAEQPENTLFSYQSFELVSPQAGWAGSGGEYEGEPYFLKWSGGALVGAQDLKNALADLQLSPNPAADRLNIRLPEDRALREGSVLILDARGKLCLRVEGVATALDIRQLPPGAYIAVVQDAQGRPVGVKQWVKAFRD